MAGGDDSDDDKPYEATQKRLDDARKKGEIPNSADLTAAGALGGLLLGSATFGADILSQIGTALSRLLSDAPGLADQFMEGPAGPASAPLFTALGVPLAIWFATPAVLALLVIIAQNSFVLSAERIKPKASKINPLSNAQNKFGRSGLFEFAKSAVKLSLIAVVLALFLAAELPGMMVAMALEPGQVIALMLSSAMRFIGVVFVLTASIGGVDLLWQRAEHARKNRMSRKEMTDEMKESDGDPHVKGQRRQRGIEIAMSQMLADVPTADVVIVNPTHYSVALKWDRAAGSAPVCVAKGVDEIALRIREKAMECGVPVRADPPTARALYRVVEVGQEIPPDQYRAVAVAIRFADRIRAMSSKRKGGANG